MLFSSQHARADECVVEDGAGVRSTGGGSTSDTDTLACGTNATASGNWAQAIGNNAEASGVDSLAVGNSALATEQWAFAVGNLSAATAVRSTAVGTGTDAEAEDSVAIGWNAFASAPSTIALGSAAEATGEGSIAFGTGSVALGQNSIAIGNGALASANGQVVISSLDTSTASQSGPVQVVTADGQGTLGLMAIASSAEMSSAQSAIKSLENASVVHAAQIDALFSSTATKNAQIDALFGITASNTAQIESLLNLTATQAAQIDSLFGQTAANRDAIRRTNEGVALALAMESPTLPAGTNFALSGGVGYFDDTAAGSMAMTARVNDRAALSAGIGVGFETGEVGARGGFQVAW